MGVFLSFWSGKEALEKKELEPKLLDLSLAVREASFGGKKLQAFLLFCLCLCVRCFRVFVPKVDGFMS